MGLQTGRVRMHWPLFWTIPVQRHAPAPSWEAWEMRCMTAIPDQIATGHSVTGIQVDRINPAWIMIERRPSANAKRRLIVPACRDDQRRITSQETVTTTAVKSSCPRANCSAIPPRNTRNNTMPRKLLESGIDFQSPRSRRRFHPCQHSVAINPGFVRLIMIPLLRIR